MSKQKKTDNTATPAAAPAVPAVKAAPAGKVMIALTIQRRQGSWSAGELHIQDGKVIKEIWSDPNPKPFAVEHFKVNASRKLIAAD